MQANPSTHRERPATRPKALVTGASRGIGAQISIALAQAGWDVALGYRDKERRARAVAEHVERLGATARMLAADIHETHERAQLIAEVRAWAARLDALVLNAAGSVLDAEQYDAADAQTGIARALMERLSPQGTVLYMTSHWAHLYGVVQPFPGRYDALAAAKQRTEHALRALQPELDARRIRLVVVTAGLVTGTLVGDMAARRYPAFAAEQRATGNVLTAEWVGERVAGLVAADALPSGHTEVLGASLESMVLPTRSYPAREEQRNGIRR